jgi:hypothetical protein
MHVHWRIRIRLVQLLRGEWRGDGLLRRHLIERPRSSRLLKNQAQGIDTGSGV